MGNASYRVSSAATQAQPAARVETRVADPDAWELGVLESGTWELVVDSAALQSAMSATARKVVPNNRGSVIGVLCRYSTSGLSISSDAATPPPIHDPVARAISRAIAHDASAIDATAIAIAEKPVRYSQSDWTGIALSRWGSGSHTAPTCCQPG